MKLVRRPSNTKLRKALLERTKIRMRLECICWLLKLAMPGILKNLSLKMPPAWGIFLKAIIILDDYAI